MQVTPLRHKGEQGGIHSTADLDRVVKLIGLCDVRLQQVNTNLKLEIDKLKTEALAQAQEAEKERKMLLALAQTYVEANRDELLKTAKSLKLNFGRVGYRKLKDKFDHPKKATPEMEALVKQIEELSKEHPEDFEALPIIVERHVQKTAMAALSDKAFELLGLEWRQGDDEFFVEPDKAKVQVPDEPRAAIGG